mgnify:CR=1 FL=1
MSRRSGKTSKKLEKTSNKRGRNHDRLAWKAVLFAGRLSEKDVRGKKVYKLSLDGGMTCPNRDGTCGDRGCIFCSAGGSGDFAGDRNKSIPEQIREQKSLLQQKRPVHKFIAYFQAYTNTYAPVEYLEKISGRQFRTRRSWSFRSERDRTA